MPAKLTLSAVEKSTIVITASFHDEAGSPMIPSSISWKLTDRGGNVINSRNDVVVSPAASIDIVLSGDDLSLERDKKTDRILTVYGTYNSTYGIGLPFADSAIFPIEALVSMS